MELKIRYETLKTKTPIGINQLEFYVRHNNIVLLN